MYSLEELKKKIEKYVETKKINKNVLEMFDSIKSDCEKILNKKDNVINNDDIANIFINLISISNKLDLDLEDLIDKKIMKDVKKPIESPKDSIILEPKEVKEQPKEKTIGFSHYGSDYDKEFYLDFFKKTISKYEKKYNNYSKESLINEIIAYYDKNKILPYLLSEEEILFLKVNKSKKVDEDASAYKFLKKLMLFAESNGKIAMSTELYDIIARDIAEYTVHKDKIEAKKENAYLLVGIMRVFGALTSDEMNKILSKYAKESIGDFYSIPYAVRFIDYRDEYGVSYFALKNLGIDAVSIVESHKGTLKCSYSKKELIGIGKAYFNVHSPEYKVLSKNSKAVMILNSIDKDGLIISALKDEELKPFIMDFYTDPDITDKDRTYINSFLKSLPRI